MIKCLTIRCFFFIFFTINSHSPVPPMVDRFTSVNNTYPFSLIYFFVDDTYFIPIITSTINNGVNHRLTMCPFTTSTYVSADKCRLKLYIVYRDLIGKTRSTSQHTSMYFTSSHILYNIGKLLSTTYISTIYTYIYM